jgi:nucleotide-binding universal stress UspA family protein
MNYKSIVWAVDPYQNNAQTWTRSKELALKASQALKKSLRPVYVADRSFLPALSAFKTGQVTAFIEASRTKLTEMLSPLAKGKVHYPEVIFSDDVDMDAKVVLLGKYTSRVASPFIVSATTAKRGLRRFVEGSFAESIVGHSGHPVLLVNPDCPAVRSFKRIVFATDFSPLSKKSFKKICHFARASGASIHVVSILPDPLYWSDPSVAAGMGVGSYLGLKHLEVEAKRLRKTGEAMVKLAQKLKIKATFKLEEKPYSSVSKAILANATSAKGDLLALAARGDTSAVHFFGSAAQDVIRHSKIPVWIYHAEKLKKRSSK